MPSFLLQAWAVAAMNLKSLPSRPWASLSTILALALTVMVLLGFLALGTGIKATLDGAGSDAVAIVLREGSPDESASMLGAAEVDLIEDAPQVARQGDSGIVSPERFVVVKGVRKDGGGEANVSLRGIGRFGLTVRPDVRIAQGRMLSPGSNEMIVGAALAREFAGYELGREIRIGNASWRIVGLFEQGGSVNESEAWVDINALQSFYKAGASFQSARVLLARPDALKALNAHLKADPRLDVTALSERRYFARQASSAAFVLRALGWPLAIAMAVGALAGALNAMYSSVAERRSEIATLRAIGFSPASAFVGTIAEGLALALAGALLGAALAWLIFSGITTSTMGPNFTQIVFKFRLAPADYSAAIVLALIVGFLGGLLPAWRAAATPLTAAQSD